MIAEVFTGSIGQVTDEFRNWADGSLAEARTQDGVEGCLGLTDTATGDLLTVILFRDQAARDAYQAFLDKKVAEAGNLGIDVLGRIYPEVISH
jgi:hypothetical protein